jgi:hypothetical protein
MVAVDRNELPPTVRANPQGSRSIHLMKPNLYIKTHLFLQRVGQHGPFASFN